MMQRYVSNELTHFVGRSLREVAKDREQLLSAQYSVLLKIIKEKCISYPPHWTDQIPPGMKYSPISRTHLVPKGNFSSNDMVIPSMICFCDIPIADLGIHIRKYSNFGLSFPKSFLIERGTNPVLYVERNSSIQNTTRSEYFDDNFELYLNYI
jgi:hypothetical protein